MPTSHLTKEIILKELQKGIDEVIFCVRQSDDAIFLKKSDTKWSIAENLEHLRLSVKPLKLAFGLPKFILLFFGKPNRPIRTYDELVKKYMQALNEGGKASPGFVPAPTKNNKSSLIDSFVEENKALITRLEKWNEKDMDRYLLPHPLLGKLYAREMLYFTIYHTQHHRLAIEKLM